MEPRLAKKVVERMLGRISRYVIGIPHVSDVTQLDITYVTQRNVTNGTNVT